MAAHTEDGVCRTNKRRSPIHQIIRGVDHSLTCLVSVIMVDEDSRAHCSKHTMYYGLKSLHCLVKIWTTFFEAFQSPRQMNLWSSTLYHLFGTLIGRIFYQSSPDWQHGFVLWSYTALVFLKLLYCVIFAFVSAVLFGLSYFNSWFSWVLPVVLYWICFLLHDKFFLYWDAGLCTSILWSEVLWEHVVFAFFHPFLLCLKCFSKLEELSNIFAVKTKLDILYINCKCCLWYINLCM